MGVLGLGSIGRRHIRNLLHLGQNVLAFDPAPDSGKQFAEEFGEGFSTREKVLDAADALVIASPNAFHLCDLEDAIANGIPTLVEKPFAHDANRAAELVKRAKCSGLIIAAAHNLRYRLVVQRVRELISSGLIGKPLWAHFLCASWLPDWRPHQDYRTNYAADRETGGVIFDLIHELDLAFHLLGPAEVHSGVAVRSGVLEIESEDMADLVLRHASGCQTSLHLDYITRPRRRCFTIAGVDGMLTADLLTGAVRVAGRDDATLVEEIRQSDRNEEYILELQDFLRALDGDKSRMCPADEAVAVLRLACDARRLAGLSQAGVDRGLARQESA